MDLDSIADELGVYDHGSEHDDVIDSIARGGEYLADAISSVSIAERDYRQWRGKTTIELLALDPKLAEWKVKAHVDGDVQFKTFKTELATRQLHVDTLRGFLDALKMRAASYE